LINGDGRFIANWIALGWFRVFGVVLISNHFKVYCVGNRTICANFPSGWVYQNITKPYPFTSYNAYPTYYGMCTHAHVVAMIRESSLCSQNGPLRMGLGFVTTMLRGFHACLPLVYGWFIYALFKLFQSQYDVHSESNVSKTCQIRDFKNVELLNVFMSNLKHRHKSLCIGIHNITQSCASNSWAMEYNRGYESCWGSIWMGLQV
jgi:hypothetical protein